MRILHTLGRLCQFSILAVDHHHWRFARRSLSCAVKAARQISAVLLQVHRTLATMKVKSARAAELSDYEVLKALREMDKRQQAAVAQASEKARAVSAAGIGAGDVGGLSIEEQTLQSLPANLRTIQYEVLETLRNVMRPCAHQTSEQITRFMDALAAWERARPVEGVPGLKEDSGLDAPIERERRLTKGERLMLINHAPTSEIELYPLVEEIEDRFSADQRQDILAIVAAHLPLDQHAMQAEQRRAEAAAQSQGKNDVEFDQDGDRVYVGHDGLDEDERFNDGVADADNDMDMLEHEAREGPAVDDEGPDE